VLSKGLLMPSDIPNSRSGPLDGITVVASGDHVACDLDGDAVILHLSTGTYFGLNAVASQVWKLIQSPATASAICEILLEEYDVNRDACEQDMLALLEDLSAKGLVVLTYTSPGTEG
jgi:hypothetical protein